VTSSIPDKAGDDGDIVVLDWGGGNLGSVMRAFRRLGVEAILSAEPERIRAASRLVFPGVGAFGAVMEGLRESGTEEVLMEWLRANERPFLGICVGLQALFEASEESPGVAGLGIFPGTVTKLKARKVPQVGWNEIIPSSEHPVLPRGYAYFVNSFAAPAEQGVEWVAATTEHGGTFASAVQDRNILAVQFHPEKSGRYGAALLRRWLVC